MGPFTLICSDLDGTLLDNASRISPYSEEMVARVRAEGAVFCLASGRPPAMMMAYYARLGLDSPIIANNGSIVWFPQTKKCLRHCPIPAEPALDFLSYCEKRDLDWAVFTLDTVYIKNSQPRLRRYGEYNALASAAGVPPLRVEVIPSAAQAREALLRGSLRISVVFRRDGEEAVLEEFFSQDRGLTHVHSTPESYDVLAPNVNKWGGILAVGQYYGIPEDRICVFGNDINDMEMVSRAKTAFVVANAEQPLLELPATLIGSNEEEGVAHAIGKYILGSIVPPPPQQLEGGKT